MINITCVNFIIFSIVDILFLTLAGYINKRYIIAFPNKLIPILNILTSLVITCLWGVISKHDHTILFCAQVGVIYGMASIGLHQAIKQTIDYFKIRRYIREKFSDESHIVSMSD